MSNEWKPLPTMEDVAKAKADGWDIYHCDASGAWFKWMGFAWQSDWEFRGRKPLPAMKKVKLEAWLDSRPELRLIQEGFIPLSTGWIRVPSEDKMIEVPA